MKIIKKGIIVKSDKRFSCRNCGTIFDADNEEYQTRTKMLITLYYCTCPVCGERVIKAEPCR